MILRCLRCHSVAKEGLCPAAAADGERGDTFLAMDDEGGGGGDDDDDEGGGKEGSRCAVRVRYICI